MQIKIILFIPFCVMALSVKCYCQQSISGPTCVLAGLTYQYDLKLVWDGTTPINLCVRGGTIEGQTSNCIKANSLSYIRVNWMPGVDNGSISFTYGEMKDSIIIYLTTPLFPGTIDTNRRVQPISGGSIPKQINCTFPSGGNCNALYTYQWQQSQDGQSWQDLEGAIELNYSFVSPPAQTTFYRRKTTENKSHATAFSEEAIIVIIAADVKSGN